MLSDMYAVWYGGQWVNSARQTWTYDAEGNMNSYADDTWLNSSWTGVETSLVITDSAGNQYPLLGHSFAYTYRSVVPGDDGNPPSLYSLSQNYPNPFNPGTTIRYALPNPSEVSVRVYDILGREVSVLASGGSVAGVHEVKFDGSLLASGVYICRFQAGDFTATKRLLLLK
jgi:hypothetical protein